MLTVAEIRTLRSGKSPVRISQIASKTIPILLPARVLVIATLYPLLFAFLKVGHPFWIGSHKKPTCIAGCVAAGSGSV